MSQPTLRHQKGFTLIEVVVSLIIFGVMGSMLFAFLASSVVRSTEPVRMTQDLAQAQDDLEEVVSAYSQCLRSAPDFDNCGDWNAFADNCNFDASCTEMTIGGFSAYRFTYTRGNQTLAAFFPALD